MPDQFNILDQGLLWPGPDLLESGEGTFPRALVAAGNVSTTSQSMRIAYFTARKSEAITSVRIFAGGQAAGATPSLVRVGIWTSNADGDLLSLVGSTANDTTLLATINTAYTKALEATFNKVAGQRYAMGLLVVSAQTMPQILAQAGNLNIAESALRPRLSAVLNSQADLPATVAAASLSANANRPYFALVP